MSAPVYGGPPGPSVTSSEAPGPLLAPSPTGARGGQLAWAVACGGPAASQLRQPLGPGSGESGGLPPPGLGSEFKA